MMVDMDHTAVAIALCLLGVFLGSFTGASVWRVRKRQLKQDVKDGYKVSETAQRQVEKLKSKYQTYDGAISEEFDSYIVTYEHYKQIK